MNQKIPNQSRIDKSALILGITLLTCGLMFLLINYSVKHFLLLIIGFGLGVSLYHAAFGFTGAWRRFIINKEGNGIRAQLFAIALASLLILPLLKSENYFGSVMVGSFGPIGISVLVGSFIFGLGMQLGGGCGSGTLFTVGSGNTRMMITLISFIVGSVLGTLHLPWWLSLPSLSYISLSESFGVYQAILFQWAILGCIALTTIFFEKQKNGKLQNIYIKDDRRLIHILFYGGWPLLWGGLALALLNFTTLIVAGHPWSVTFAFGLWGAKVLSIIGVEVSQWEYWTWSYPAQALRNSVLNDSVSLTNFGLIIGALVAASLARKITPIIHISFLSLIAALVGGLLMGYGARLAFGCNIGAMFSGIASGSVHGWLWFASAFLGSYFGVKLRPHFGLL